VITSGRRLCDEEMENAEKMEKFWMKNVPDEIRYIRSLLSSQFFINILKFMYFISCILMCYGIITLLHSLSSSHHSSNDLLFIAFYMTYALFYISLLPYIVLFLSNILLSSDLLPFFQHEEDGGQNEDDQPQHLNNSMNDQTKRMQYFTFPFKASLISKFNFLSCLAVSIAYSFNTPLDGTEYYLAIMFSFIFILPTSTMFILACYLLELYRIQEMNYLTEIISFRNLLYQYRYKELHLTSTPSQHILNINSTSTNLEIDANVSSLQTNLIENERRESSSPTNLPVREIGIHVPLPSSDLKETLASLLERYNQLQIYSHSISHKYGHVFFLCLLNSIAVIISSIWSLYRKEYSVGSSLGYVFVGLIFFHQIAYLIVEINEKSFLISRELSNCILTIRSFLPSTQSTTSLEPGNDFSSTRSAPIFVIRLTGEDLNQYNLFLNCMEYTKIQIFFMGNFVLRFRTLLGFISSVLAALIPGIVR
jgi:hypothetical protein